MQVSLPPEPHQLRRQLLTSLPSSSLPGSSLPSSADNLPYALDPLYGGVRIANSALRQLRATPYTGGVRFWSEAAIQIRSLTAARYSLYGRCSFLVGSGDPDLLSDSYALLPKRAVLVHGQKRRS